MHRPKYSLPSLMAQDKLIEKQKNFLLANNLIKSKKVKAAFKKEIRSISMGTKNVGKYEESDLDIIELDNQCKTTMNFYRPNHTGVDYNKNCRDTIILGSMQAPTSYQY